jgi:uncharacterized protein YoxC
MEATSMTDTLMTVAASAPSMALRYAAAFFLVVVGAGLIYALLRLGGALRAADKLLGDVDGEVVPLLKQATETLDGVNAELDKVDVVMSSVVDVTEKVDQTTRAVESAISVPARKAAAFGAGVSQAVSSFFNRGEGGEPAGDDSARGPGAGEPAATGEPAPGWGAPSGGRHEPAAGASTTAAAGMSAGETAGRPAEGTAAAGPAPASGPAGTATDETSEVSGG